MRIYFRDVSWCCYLFQWVTVEDVAGYDIRSIKDQWKEDGEEGEATEHRQQNQPCCEQQGYCKREGDQIRNVCMCQVHSSCSVVTRAHIPSQNTKPAADVTMVTRANVRKSPTGTAAMVLNSMTVRAAQGWVLRYCPTLDFSTRATWWRDRDKRRLAEKQTHPLSFTLILSLWVLPWGHHKGSSTCCSTLPTAAESCCFGRHHRYCRSAAPSPAPGLPENQEQNHVAS